MNPKISIIVPIYNASLYLEETIQTVLNQTYPTWELILIDDGSTDDSAEICKRYQERDERITYQYKENGGQATARNLGILLSTGAWIAMLDSDDLWHPEKLQKQVEVIQNQKSIDLCFTNTSYFKNSIENAVENYDNFPYGILDHNRLFKQIYRHNYIANSSVLIKKSLLEKVGKIDENPVVVGSEDWELLLRIFKSGAPAFGLSEQLLYYRLHEGGIHNQSTKMFKGKTYVYAKYDQDNTIPRLLKLRQNRYVYRELMNFLWAEKRAEELKTSFKSLQNKDAYGIATIKQGILLKILPLSSFMWISQKIIYRIAYRVESISYYFFLK